MPTYSNGRLPRSALVAFGSGHDKDGRFYEWLLPPATYRKHLALVDLGRQRSGKTLRPSVGYSCYRPLDEQHYARRVHGIYAADPGKSSHGGDWAGPPTGWRLVDASAIDYSNYVEVFGSESAFFAACRQVGLLPQGIWPPAFPREAWHVIDLDPYAAVPAFDNSNPFNLEEDMAQADIDHMKAQLNAALTVLGNMQNALGLDPEHGVYQQASNAAAWAGNANTIAGEIRNLINDPTNGILAAISRVSAGDVDVDALAAQLKESLAPEIAAELGKRLANG